jgi:hypothetical protein
MGLLDIMQPGRAPWIGMGMPDIRAGTIFAPPELPGVGAKPLASTPPFAPPHAQTGGAEIPTTPETRPAKHGLAGFLGRFVNSGGLGDLGAMIAALGTNQLPAVMAAVQQRRGSAGQHEQERAEHWQDWQRQYDYEVGHPKPSNAGPHYWESNDGSLHAIGDDGKPVEVYHDPTPKMNFIPDGMGGGSWVAVPNAAPGGASPNPPIGTVVDDPRKTAQPASYGAFKSAIIGQESGGRYGVPNAEGSGAMGIGQVMPGTARVLAGRLGLPYNPGLLAGNDPNSRAYQDQITEAAVREAWEAGGGDPRTAAMYYFGGSDRGKWGPKTRRYGNSVIGRMGG